MAARKKTATRKKSTRKKATRKKRVRRSLDGTSKPVLDAYGLRETKPAVFSSGCTLLDLALGGGWARGRCSNVVGDRSTGKTLLAEEGAANFLMECPDGDVDYWEFEGAFDMSYAEGLGMPLDRIRFPNDDEECRRAKRASVQYIEEWAALHQECVFKNKKPRLVIVDSLDAMGSLEDEKSIATGADGKSGWQLGKQKALSQLFRNTILASKTNDVTLMVISQVRDAIGVVFGEKLRRSGGKALDFYASQVVWLANMGQLKITRKGVKRTVGVGVRARCKKNKIAPPFREAEFPLLFGYGVDDVAANLDWLIELRRTEEIGMPLEDAKKLRTKLDRLSQEEYDEERSTTCAVVREVWAEIEREFQPTRRKYGAQKS